MTMRYDGGPARIRTGNQTVMSKAHPEKSEQIQGANQSVKSGFARFAVLESGSKVQRTKEQSVTGTKSGTAGERVMSDDERGAVLQMEFDIARLTKTTSFHAGAYGEKPWDRIYAIAKTAACDTIANGGTFVLVVGGGKITMVQRPDADPI